MDDKRVIILNKIFSGSWNDKEGNISHEIIDFVKSDNGKVYIYNEPYGLCPSDIYVGENPKGKEQYKADYLLLTGAGKNAFEILYCIKLRRKLHNCTTSRATLNSSREYIIENIIKKENIKYGGQYLHNIYGDGDDSLLLTFEAEKIFKPKEGKQVIASNLTYNFQRNKGYLKSDGQNSIIEYGKLSESEKTDLIEKYKNDYTQLSEIIANHENWEEYRPENITMAIKSENPRHTFLDLLLKTDSETCFTRILCSILSYDNLINLFCKKFAVGKMLDETEKFIVEPEKTVENGRMDIRADNGKQRVVIENKIFSGLNGIQGNGTTQLNTYYKKWATKDRIYDPLCFIVAPTFRLKEIEAEIEASDNKSGENMKDKYQVIGYDKIVEFISENRTSLQPPYEYARYVDDYIAAFKLYEHKTKQAYYNGLFSDAIAISNTTNLSKKRSSED